MVKALLFDPKKKATDSINSPGAGNAKANFDSTGVAEVTDPEKFYVDHVGLTEVGVPKLLKTLDAALDAATTYTVPAGKTWRLLSAILELETDATVANRTLTLTTTTSADVAIETFTMATRAASGVQRTQVVFEDRTQGTTRVEPVGTLTMDTIPAAGNTLVINGVTLTFVALSSITANGQIDIGANVAATKVNLNAALGDTRSAGSHSVTDAIHASLDVTAVDFAGNDMVFTYSGEGNATVDGEAVGTAITAVGANAFGATTLGDTTAGVGAGTKEGSTRFPVAGTILTAGQKITITEPVAEDAGDDVDIYITVLEYDHNPVTVAPQGF